MSLIGTEAFSTSGASFGLTIPVGTKAILLTRTSTGGAATNIPTSLGGVALTDYPPLIDSERREAVTYGLDITGRSNDTLTLSGGVLCDYIAMYIDELLVFLSQAWSGLAVGVNSDTLGPSPTSGTVYVATAAHSHISVAGDIAWTSGVTQTSNVIADNRRLLQGYAVDSGAVGISVTRDPGLPGSDVLTGWVRSAFYDDVPLVVGGSGMMRRRRGIEDIDLWR